ncbi:MAG: YitT family protein [Herpetosiphon sp.]
MIDNVVAAREPGIPSPHSRRQVIRRLVQDYLLILTGAVCMAIALDLFLVPNGVVSGGVTGVGIILHDLFGVPVGVVILLLNIPLLLVGWRNLGGLMLGVRTIVGTIALALATDALAPIVGHWLQAPRDPLLYTLYGGMLDGVGMGMVFRGRGTTGGVDIIARLLQRLRGIPMGRSLLAMNLVVFAGAAYLFGLEKVLYAAIVAFVSSQVIDVVLAGFSYAQQAIIISDQPELIRRRILSDLDRGVTLLEGRGGYTNGDRTVLLTVVARSEVSALKYIITDVDRRAFVIIGEVAEVTGEGFRTPDTELP